MLGVFSFFYWIISFYHYWMTSFLFLIFSSYDA